MNTFLRIAMMSVLSVLTLQAATAVEVDTAAQAWKFDVYLDDELFGTHEVRLRRDDGETTIITSASFEYRLLFIPLYNYEHTTTETWNGSCVSSIVSRTDDNGDIFFIDARRSGESLLVDTQAGSQTLDNCVRTFAYWNLELLQTDKLLNTQNGKYQASRFMDKGVSILEVNGKKFEARRCELDTEAGLITLWYDNDDRWIALESIVENGSKIRYIASDLLMSAVSMGGVAL